jgi:hypothetical protein
MRYLRPTAIAGLLLAAATLSSCGFDYPTDRVNTIAAGVNDRDASVDALGIRVLASAPGQGRLIGTLANNTTEDAALKAISSPEGKVEAAEFKPVKVRARSSVNLVNVQLPLTGDFTAGQFVKMALEFSTGETVSLDVPVVKPCFQYSDIPAASAAASESATADEHATEEHATEETEHATDEHATDEHATDGHDDATYTCADELDAPGGGH